ncbi:MAG: transposase [Lachnospiraceae bacterium]|nr:transposase [Lachnospiraceae bacterium]
MPRGARKTSSTDIYHVMLRGINRQDIFEEDEDKKFFLWIIRECIKVSGCDIYAYCLMSNHVHILIRTKTESIGVIMKRIGTRYVLYFNEKYGRVGHLFQDRFISEAVEDDRYFLTVLRYIIQNPMKAGIEQRPGSYMWSSYRTYVDSFDHITDTSIAIDMAGGKEKLIEFLNENNNDTAIDVSEGGRKLSDKELKRKMLQVTGCMTISDYQNISKEEQRVCVLKMRKSGFSLAQIARMIGRSKTLIHKIVKEG